MAEVYYLNPTSGRLTLEGVTHEIINFISENIDKKYHLIIGSDSDGRGEIDLVNAIVIHRLGCGGRYFWYKTHREKIDTLRQKIYEEVNLSIETTLKLLELLKKHQQTLVKCEIEVHVDIGENGETREMIKEIVGMVKGYGLAVKTKPEAYGATKVADRHV